MTYLLHNARLEVKTTYERTKSRLDINISQYLSIFIAILTFINAQSCYEYFDAIVERDHNRWAFRKL